MRGDLAFFRENAPWLLAGLTVSLLSTFGQTAFVAVFSADLSTRFDLGPGGWGTVYAIATMLSAAAMLWAGALTDRVPLGALTGWTLVALAGCCIAVAALLADTGTAAPGAWALVAAVLGLRLLGQGMLSHIAYVALARWFVARRGQALAIGVLGFALGQSTLPLGFATARDVGVPASILWLAAAAVALTSAWPLRRAMDRVRTPTGTGPADGPVAGSGPSAHQWTRREALRTATFWGTMPALLGTPAFGTAFFFFQVHLPETKGWTQVGFVSLFPLIFGVSTVSAFATGTLLRHVAARRLLAPSLLPLAAGFAGMAVAPTLGWAVVPAVAMALSMGAMQVVPTALWAELFGTRHIGAIKAVAAAVLVLGTALGPGLVGWWIEAGVPFAAQMPWIAAYLLLSAGLAATVLARPPARPQAERGPT